MLTFESFDVEYDSNCRSDWVEVAYGEFSERLCGGENGDYLPGPFTSCEGSSMVVKFHSNWGITGTGFRAVWEELTTATPCPAGGSIQSHADVWNIDYPNNVDQVERHHLHHRVNVSIHIFAGVDTCTGKWWQHRANVYFCVWC